MIVSNDPELSRIIGAMLGNCGLETKIRCTLKETRKMLADQDGYNYYFRQGFRRGYEDGYYSRARYGRYSNGSYSILGAILSQVLNFQALR